MYHLCRFQLRILPVPHVLVTSHCICPCDCSCPGWETSSVGFHTDDCNVFHGNDAKKEYSHGRKPVSGDVIGCGLDLVDRSFFVTVNGSTIGTSAHSYNICSVLVFPSAGAYVILIACTSSCFSELPLILQYTSTEKGIFYAVRPTLCQFPPLL